MLVEALIAMVVFAIVATGVVDMLVSSTSITTLAKQRTLAEQGVSNQIEWIRVDRLHRRSAPARRAATRPGTDPATRSVLRPA